MEQRHIVREDLWAPPLFGGSTIREVGDRFEGDCLGDDPKASWIKAKDQAIAAAAADGALERIVHLSFGDMPGREYAMQLFADHLIHGWDLARGIGADDHLDTDLVSACKTWFEPIEELYRGAVQPERVPRSPREPTSRPCCWRCSAAGPDSSRVRARIASFRGLIPYQLLGVAAMLPRSCLDTETGGFNDGD